MKTQFFKRTAIALVVGGAAAVMSTSVFAESVNQLDEIMKLKAQVAKLQNSFDSADTKNDAQDRNFNNLTKGISFNNDGSLTLVSDPNGNHQGLGAVFENIDNAAKANSNGITENGNKITSLETNKVDKTAFDEAMNNNGARLEAVDGRVTDLASTSVHKDDFNALSGRVETNEGRIAAFIQNVNDNLEAKVIDNGSNIEKNTTNISANTANIATHENVITSLEDHIDDIDDDIDELGQDIDKHDVRIEANEKQIAAINERHDKVDAEKRAALEKAIAYNAEEITTLEDQFAVLGAIHNTEEEQIQALAEHRARQDVEIHNLDTRLNRLDKKLKRGLASQAALSGLFQPYTVGKFNATAAVGGYNSQQAVAVGAGYRFNEHVAGKAGVAFAGHGDVSYHAGVNFEW